MDIKIISAVSIDGAIGNDNEMLWHLPEDFKKYKSRTTGNILIVGRNTYNSLPSKALQDRTHIVIKQNDGTYLAAPKDFPGADIYSVHSIEEAIKKAEKLKTNEQEVFIIGGSEIYKQSIDLCNEAEITWINKTYPEANKKFPIDKLFNDFEITGDSNWVMSKNETLYKFTYYKRN